MCLASDLNELIVGIVSVLSLDCIQGDGSVQLPASQEISTTQVQLALTGHLQSHVSLPHESKQYEQILIIGPDLNQCCGLLASNCKCPAAIP